MPVKFGAIDIEYLGPRNPYVVFKKVQLKELKNEIQPDPEIAITENQGNAKESPKPKADPKQFI